MSDLDDARKYLRGIFGADESARRHVSDRRTIDHASILTAASHRAVLPRRIEVADLQSPARQRVHAERVQAILAEVVAYQRRELGPILALLPSGERNWLVMANPVPSFFVGFWESVHNERWAFALNSSVRVPADRVAFQLGVLVGIPVGILGSLTSTLRAIPEVAELIAQAAWSISNPLLFVLGDSFRLMISRQRQRARREQLATLQHAVAGIKAVIRLITNDPAFLNQAAADLGAVSGMQVSEQVFSLIIDKSALTKGITIGRLVGNAVFEVAMLFLPAARVARVARAARRTEVVGAILRILDRVPELNEMVEAFRLERRAQGAEHAAATVAEASAGRPPAQANVERLVQRLTADARGANRVERPVATEFERRVVDRGAQGRQPPRTIPLAQQATHAEEVEDALKGIRRLTPEIKNWLRHVVLKADPLRIQRAAASLRGARQWTIDAINAFWRVDKFDQVAAAWFTGGNNRKGANLVMRYALENFAGRARLTMIFEFETVRPAWRVQDAERRLPALRKLDLWVEGVRYEFKSVQELRTALVRREGRAGQLVLDLIYQLNSGLRYRWVFDGPSIGMNRAEVVAILQQLVSQESGLLRDYRQMDRILRAIDEMVIVWREPVG